MKLSSDRLSLAAKTRLIAFGVALLACASGCLTPNPATLAITERDKAIYSDKGAVKQEQEKKARVAIFVSHGDYKDAKQVAKLLDSTLTSVISGFEFFEIVERSNLGALMQEDALKSLGEDENNLPEIPDADYMITASINKFHIVRLTNLQTKQPYIRAKQGVDFRFYEIESKRVILTRNYETHFSCDADMNAVISKAVDFLGTYARTFGMELGLQYAPPARVLETRGEAKVARISMGRNYGVERGVKLEFFEYIDNSDVIESTTREPCIVARGTTIETDLKSAWVKVDNYKKTPLKRGHYVRIRFD
jgi:Uncharacterized protein involved in formation of curli polymers